MFNNERNIVVACPNCGQKLEYGVFGVIDGAKDEYQKLAILNDKFFELTCSKCGHQMNMLYEFAYCDSDKKFIIYFVNEERSDGANVALQLNHQFAYQMGQKPFITRIVYEYEDLIEKICILEDGLDDRVIEIMKFFCLHNAIDELASLDIYDARYYNKDGKRAFLLEGENGTAVADFPDGMYQEVEQGFAEVFQNDTNFVIDSDWAIDMIDASEDEENDLDDPD